MALDPGDVEAWAEMRAMHLFSQELKKLQEGVLCRWLCLYKWKLAAVKVNRSMRRPRQAVLQIQLTTHLAW